MELLVTEKEKMVGLQGWFYSGTYRVGRLIVAGATTQALMQAAPRGWLVWAGRWCLATAIGCVPKLWKHYYSGFKEFTSSTEVQHVFRCVGTICHLNSRAK